jgi:hypothetical protein
MHFFKGDHSDEFIVVPPLTTSSSLPFYSLIANGSQQFITLNKMVPKNKTDGYVNEERDNVDKDNKLTTSEPLEIISACSFVSPLLILSLIKKYESVFNEYMCECEKAILLEINGKEGWNIYSEC